MELPEPAKIDLLEMKRHLEEAFLKVFGWELEVHRHERRRREMALLVLTHEGLTLKRIPLNRPELTIGRKTDSDIFVDDMLASQKHARVERVANPETPGGTDHFIQDLGSTNRTFVNGQPVDRHKLAHGDLIRIGKHTFKFIDDATDPGDKTARLKKSWIPGVYYTDE